MSGIMMTRALEQKLISLAAKGDRDAAGQLIKSHQASLYGFIFRMCGHAETAEDVVQEAFVRVLTNLDRFDSRYRFSTWLFTIARRVYLNICEKRRTPCNTDAVDGSAGASASPAAAFHLRETRGEGRDELQAALLKLPAEQREVLILFHQQDWPIWLIAEHMDMPEGTVKSHLHRGRIKLRDLIVLDRRERKLAFMERNLPPVIPQEVWT